MLTLQVFLDEVNTSSCLGLFKEIILDRTFDGVVCDFSLPGHQVEMLCL